MAAWHPYQATIRLSGSALYADKPPRRVCPRLTWALSSMLEGITYGRSLEGMGTLA